MKGMSFNAMRVGKRYRLTNFGETFEFEVMHRISEDNFEVKDISTFETYELNDFIKYGKGKDFDLDEI